MIKKLKARFCVQGDRKKGVDYFETCSCRHVGDHLPDADPRLSPEPRLQARGHDVYVSTHPSRSERYIYLNMPRGFQQYGHQGTNKVVKLKQTIFLLKLVPFLKEKR